MKANYKEKNKKTISDILQGKAITRLSIVGAILLMLIIIILALTGCGENAKVYYSNELFEEHPPVIEKGLLP